MTCITSITMERRFDPKLTLVVTVQGEEAEWRVRDAAGICGAAQAFPESGMSISHALVVAAVRNHAFAALDRMLETLCQSIQIDRGWRLSSEKNQPGGSGSGCPAVVSGGNSVKPPASIAGQAVNESTGDESP